MSPSIGLPDLPLENFNDEALGLTQYATALTLFAKQCQTPLTIALQGDWGSGKTSLMNLIKSDLVKEKERYNPIWFNTWQYSQFGLEDELALALITHFLEKLGVKEMAIVAGLRKGLRMLKNVAFAVGDTAGHLAPQAGTAGKGIAYVTGLALGDESDPAKAIAKLKKQIQDAVVAKIGKQPNEKRIVVFIDDLDRLAPGKAVELLECFKLFLDIPGCVYFLACDYQVVTQGLKMKFGDGTKELKGKNFFDKIIQLPFQMPVTQYKVDRYIRSLLDNINILNSSEPDIKQYKALIETSISFNPRNLKRAFNCLLLLNLVAEQPGDRAIRPDVAQKSETKKIIFASVCMQRAYEHLYIWLVKHAEKIDDNLLRRLGNEEAYTPDQEFAELFKKMKEEDSTVQAEKLASFMQSFYDVVHHKSDCGDQNLSDDELQVLQAVLTFSAVTATTESVAQKTELDKGLRKENRQIANNLKEELNRNQKKILQRFNAEFAVHQRQGSTGARLYIENKGQHKMFGSYIGLWLDLDDEAVCCEIYISFSSNPDRRDVVVSFPWRERLEIILPQDLKQNITCQLDQNYQNHYSLFCSEFPPINAWKERLDLLRSPANKIFAALGKMPLDRVD